MRVSVLDAALCRVCWRRDSGGTTRRTLRTTAIVIRADALPVASAISARNAWSSASNSVMWRRAARNSSPSLSISSRGSVTGQNPEERRQPYQSASPEMVCGAPAIGRCLVCSNSSGPPSTCDSYWRFRHDRRRAGERHSGGDPAPAKRLPEESQPCSRAVDHQLQAEVHGVCPGLRLVADQAADALRDHVPGLQPAPAGGSRGYQLPSAAVDRDRSLDILHRSHVDCHECRGG